MKSGPGLIADVFQLAALKVVQQEERFAIGYAAAAFIDGVVGVTTRENEIEPAVIVVVEKTQTPAAEHSGDRG